MLVKTIYDAETLRECFIACNRDYYSYESYKALIDLFEECDNGQPTELDVVAICCDFNEQTAEEIARDYEPLFSEWASDNDLNVEEMDEDEKPKRWGISSTITLGQQKPKAVVIYIKHSKGIEQGLTPCIVE